MKRYTLILLMTLAVLALLAQDPPRNLVGEAGDGEVSLSWDSPAQNGLIEIFYHDGVPYHAYYQTFGKAYGVVFDLTDNTYPMAQIDFRHSQWDFPGPHDYLIHIVDWDTRELLHTVNGNMTEVADGWEEAIDLDYTEIESGHVGIFLEPQGNASNNAYPVFDCDAQLDYLSYEVNVSDWSPVAPNGADGDFLFDLWLNVNGDLAPARHAPHIGVDADRVQGGGEMRLRGPLPLQPQRDRDLLGYWVYRDEDKVNGMILPPSVCSFVDTSVLNDSTYTYTVTAQYETGESEPSNSVELTPIAPPDVVFYDGFEGNSPLLYWTRRDADGDGAHWLTAPSAVEPHEGDRCIYSQSFHNGTMQPLTPDNWVISPEIELPDQRCYLTFWVKTVSESFPYEHIEAWVSTDDTEIEDFDTMLWSINATASDADWRCIEIDLDNWRGRDCYFGWRHCGSYDNYAIAIDDVYVVTESMAAGDDAPQPQVALLARPNPFNPETTLAFSLDAPGNVRLEIFDIRGRKTATLLDGPMPAGEHTVVWRGRCDDATPAASGVYFARITAGGETGVRKLLLLK